MFTSSSINNVLPNIFISFTLIDKIFRKFEHEKSSPG